MFGSSSSSFLETIGFMICASMLYRPPTCTSSSPIPMAVPLSATIADPCCMGLFTRDSSATVSILLRRNVCEAWPTSDKPIGQFSVIWQSLKPLPVECLRYYLLPQPLSPPIPPPPPRPPGVLSVCILYGFIHETSGWEGGCWRGKSMEIPHDAEESHTRTSFFLLSAFSRHLHGHCGVASSA